MAKKKKEFTVCPNCGYYLTGTTEEYRPPNKPRKDGSMDLYSVRFHCGVCGWCSGEIKVK